MKKVFAYQQGKKKDIGWHAEVSFSAAPKILKEIFIDGVKWYIVKGRKPCRAKEFDDFFKPNY